MALTQRQLGALALLKLENIVQARLFSVDIGHGLNETQRQVFPRSH
jgi:hypothetical protein